MTLDGPFKVEAKPFTTEAKTEATTETKKPVAKATGVKGALRSFFAGN